MFTYSGQSVDVCEGSPTITDIAVALGRIPRLCAAASVWWSYLHQAAAMMEIALWESEGYTENLVAVATQALVRQAHVAVSLLWLPAKGYEEEIQQRIHEHLHLDYPTIEGSMRELLDRASARTLRAEVKEFAPQSMRDLPIFDEDDQDSLKDRRIVQRIWSTSSTSEHTACFKADGVQAYLNFFAKPDIVAFRRKFGYLNSTKDAEQRFPGLFKPVEDKC